jgi:hypothetical protein
MNPAWEPYSPETRLENLWVIKSKFHVALLKNNLCVQLNSGSRVQPIRWLWKDSEGNSITPEIMSKEQFCDQVHPGTCSLPTLLNQLILFLGWAYTH